MPLEEFIRILGEPTKRYKVQKGREDGERKKAPEEWVQWYHNPFGTHVAPFIRVRVEHGEVLALEAGRA